jgi:hypothetical protein
MQRSTILFAPEGQMLRFDGMIFYVDDLNPEKHITWRMSRWQVFKIGCRAILAAIFV